MVNETKHKGLIKLILMVIISCITQVTSLLKSSIVAETFGVSEEMDAFNFANSMTIFVFSFVIAGISTIVIPCYVKNTKAKSRDSFLTAIFGGVAVISILILIFRIPIITTITRRNSNFIFLSGNLLAILVASNFFNIFSSVTAAYFQYIEKYNLPKIITLLSQTVVIVILGICKSITIYQYTWIIGLGVFLNASVDMIFAIKYGWCYKPNFCFKEPETRRLLQTFVPVLFSTGVYQLSLMIDSSIASRLNTGDVTVLNYANQISSMINTLLVSNLLIYFYPKLVKDIDENKKQHCFWDKTYFFHAIICLVISGYVVIGQEGVSLLFEHGKFDSRAASAVFKLSLIYILSQQFDIIRDLIYRYFYSYGNTKSTTFNSIIATIANIAASLILVYFIGLYGVVIGTAISSCVSLTAIMIRFGGSYGYAESVLRIILQYLKTIAIATVTVVLAYTTKSVFPIKSNLISILIYGCEVVIIYIVLTLIFNRNIKKTALNL